MNARDYNKLPDAQRKALFDLYERNPDGAKYLTEFITRAKHHHLLGCILITWCGMQVGIEPDGFTHS